MSYSAWNIPACRPEAPEPLVRARIYAAFGGDTLPPRPDRRRRRKPSWRAGRSLVDPFLLEDMDRAAARLRLAIERRETVAVFGDYDVDGITSACLVTSWLRPRAWSVAPISRTGWKRATA